MPPSSTLPTAGVVSTCVRRQRQRYLGFRHAQLTSAASFGLQAEEAGKQRAWPRSRLEAAPPWARPWRRPLFHELLLRSPVRPVGDWRPLVPLFTDNPSHCRRCGVCTCSRSGCLRSCWKLLLFQLLSVAAQIWVSFCNRRCGISACLSVPVIPSWRTNGFL